VQDAYSLRCVPQVHGAVRDSLGFVREVLEREFNAATDNPLVFSEDGGSTEQARSRVVSGGNFHGHPVAIALDLAAIALCGISNISERRIERMVNPDLSGLPADTAACFRAVIERAELNMSHQVWSFEQHLADLAADPPGMFFGLDDHQEVHPILFACRELGIPSLGFQLGMYARRQAAYVLERWEPGAYQWYDHVLVWGPYWEEVVRRRSRAFAEGFFLPGANKNPYSYRRLESARFDLKNILVPYEFWGNTKRIGEYMVRLMDLGWKVYFKLKPDERPERQLAAYRLPPGYAERLVPVERITDELMAEVNVVAGGMTTLLYDLLPYGKETWVFETEFRLLEDMIEDGLARRVRLEDLEDMPVPEKADRQMDYERLFRSESLESVLDKYVISKL